MDNFLEAVKTASIGGVALTALLKNPELLALIYKDLAEPAGKKVGHALSTVLDLANTLLLPIKLVNEKTSLLFTKHMESYKLKLDNIEESKLTVVPPEIGVPIIDKLTYIQDDDIAELFIQLLFTASTSDTNYNAHPQLINIINNITPDEAKIINMIYEYDYKNENYQIPFISLYAISKKVAGQIDFNTCLLDKKYYKGIVYEQNYHTYIDNLETLGLIRMDHSHFLLDDNLYEHIKAGYLEDISVINSKIDHNEYGDVDIRKGIMEITDLGQLFIKACVNKV